MAYVSLGFEVKGQDHKVGQGTVAYGKYTPRAPSRYVIPTSGPKLDKLQPQGMV